MSAPPARLSGRTLCWATVLVVGAVLSGVLTLLDLIRPGPWLPVAVTTILVLAAITATVRRMNPSRIVASTWGLAAAVLGLGVLYAGPGTGPALPMPTPSAFERLAELARSGVAAITAGKIPVEPTRGIELLVVVGAVLAFLGAEFVAIGLRRAGLSGLIVLGLWAPVLLFERILPVGVLLLGGVAYLMLLTVVRPQGSSRGSDAGSDRLRAVAVAAAVTALAVAIGPLAVSAPLYGAIRLPSGWGPGGIDGPLRLSTDLDMRVSLSQRSDRPVLTYTTDAADLGPLRMVTMDEFDGAQWHRGQQGTDLSPADGVLWPTARQIEPEQSAEVSIRIGDLDEDRLPIPLEPRSVDLPSRWSYDGARDEVVADQGSTRGLSYVVTVGGRALSPDVLRLDDAGGLPADSPYLEVPPSQFAAEIAALAREVTAEATNTYDRALALQSYFRSIENFRYATRIPAAQTEDAVWDFLTQRAGYCVQFATAMTIMARTLGIPARLGVGFLPGRPSSDVNGEYVVSGRQAHTWPELYFADAGWVRFEPTPAAQTGAPPIYADPSVAVPTATPTPTASASAASPSAVPTTAAGPRAAQNEAVGIGSASVPLVLVVGVLALLAVLATAAGMAWVARTRRRPAAEPVGPDAWWDELRSRLAAHGVSWSDATTVRQAAALLADRYAAVAQASGGPLEVEDARQAVEHLVVAVESQRYSPAPGAWSVEDLRHWVRTAEEPFTRAAEPDRSTLVAAGPTTRM